MEKFYYKKENKEICQVYNVYVASEKCLTCQFFYGYDSEEEWIKCNLYSDAYEFKNVKKENIELKKQIEYLDSQLKKGSA